jgi:hypothetical protein
MYSRQLEQLAAQHQAELRATNHRTSRAEAETGPAGGGHGPTKPIRNHTGWALVALGLKIAESGRR